MRKPLLPCALFLAVAVASGCGGGGGSSSVVPGSGPSGAGSTSASVVITIPPKTASGSVKNPAYISPNTGSISIVVTPQSGSPYPAVTVNVPGSSCTAVAGGFTCTITITATFGIDTLTIVDYAGPNATGAVLATGSLTTSFVAGATPGPPITATLTGLVKKVGLSIVHGTQLDSFVPVGQPATLNVVGEDASGAAIIGSYDQPIAVTLPAGSGLALGTSSFADSSHTTTTITYAGGPTFYNAPVNAVTITANASGGAVTQTLAFNPTSTMLSFAPGDGALTAGNPIEMVRAGTALDYVTSGTAAAGELVSFDPTTGTQTINASLGYIPKGIYVDPKFNGIWVSDAAGSQLHCYSSPTSADAPVAAATSPPAPPFRMTSDSSNNLWFSAGSALGFVPMTGQCTTGAPAQWQNLPPPPSVSPFAFGIAADSASTRVWAGDESINATMYQSTAGGAASALALPFAGDVVAVKNDSVGNIAIVGFGRGAPFAGVPFVSGIPAGTSAYSASNELPPVGFPASLGAAPSGLNGLLAIGYGQSGHVAVYVPASPSLATSLGIADPTAQPGSCTGVAVDATGQPWALCRLGNGTVLDRFILTGAWAPFPAIAHAYATQNAYVGIGGGANAVTFGAVCTGTVTCTAVPGFPRLFQVTATAVGPASMTINGSDGRSVVLPIAVQSPPPG